MRVFQPNLVFSTLSWVLSFHLRPKSKFRKISHVRFFLIISFALSTRGIAASEWLICIEKEEDEVQIVKIYHLLLHGRMQGKNINRLLQICELMPLN